MAEGDEVNNLGERIRSLRLCAGMTQSDLADKLFVTKATVSSYEKGIKLPSYDVLIKMTSVFNVTSDYLLGIEKDSNVDFSGLTEKEIKSIKKIIKAIQNR